ncbi:MAG: glycosyltransferase family A protein [Lachnospiraceae bacterium]|nr:glycosyltransferase family A protein [Lachnospiraceae bacterium]
MKVSIITPFHRGEAYLRDCAESLRAQEFRDFEWILVLDQAEEDISALLQEFRESFPIKVVYLEPGESQTLANGSSKVAAKGLGTAIARNRGIEEAEGEYLYFLDSDDYLYEEAIGTLVQAAEEEDAQVTYGKKVWTWYTRAGFLSTFRQSEAGDSEGGEEEEDSDKGGAGDEAEAEESSNGEETEESSDAADAADADALDTLESVEEQPELSPEEQLERARRRTAKRLISKRRGIRNISILHILIRRDLIEQYQIRFNEQFRD